MEEKVNPAIAWPKLDLKEKHHHIHEFVTEKCHNYTDDWSCLSDMVAKPPPLYNQKKWPSVSYQANVFMCKCVNFLIGINCTCKCHDEVNIPQLLENRVEGIIPPLEDAVYCWIRATYCQMIMCYTEDGCIDQAICYNLANLFHGRMNHLRFNDTETVEKFGNLAEQYYCHAIALKREDWKARLNFIDLLMIRALDRVENEYISMIKNADTVLKNEIDDDIRNCYKYNANFKFGMHLCYNTFEYERGMGYLDAAFKYCRQEVGSLPRNEACE